MRDTLSKAKDETMRRAAVHAICKVPQLSKQLMTKAFNHLKPCILAAVMGLSPTMTMQTAGANNTFSKNGSTEFQAYEKEAFLQSDILQKMVLMREYSVIDNLGEFLKTHKDVKLDLSNICFSKQDLELMKGKESEESKKLSQLAREVSTPPGYCARHMKIVLNRGGFLDHLSKEQRMEFMNVGSADQLMDYFEKGYVKGLVKINWDKDAAEMSSKPISVVRIRSGAPGAVYGHAAVDDNFGSHCGQNTPYFPSGHRDANGNCHPYGKLEITCVLEKDAVALTASMINLYDHEKNSVVSFRENEIPQQYQEYIAAHQENKEKTYYHSEWQYPRDASYVAQNLNIKKTLEVDGIASAKEANIETLLADAGNKTSDHNKSESKKEISQQDIVKIAAMGKNQTRG